MADWDDGYVTDVAYTDHFHRETTPIWLATAATWLGCTCPDLTRPFRYADLGCGNGATALVVAATMPAAEVWAYDFNPAHIQSGRDIARRAGLGNIHFEEASFGEIAVQSRDTPPSFDYIVAHGVLSWISPANQSLLVDVIGQLLAPGGIAYISYNVSTGWTGMPPIQMLMRLLTEASVERTDLAAAGALDTLDKMRQAGADMFRVYPGLEHLLARFRGRDQRYVAHEFLNRHWHTMTFKSVASAMRRVKCDYIGSASLIQNVTVQSVPPRLRDMFGQARDVGLRETVRDIASGASFRRDLFQRGPRRLSAAESRRRNDEIRLTRTFREAPETLKIDAAFDNQLTVNHALYRSIMDALDSGPVTFGELRRDRLPRDQDLTALSVVVAALLGNAYIDPMLPGDRSSPEAIASAAQMNAVHAALIDDANDRPMLAIAALGTAWHTNSLDILALDELRVHGELDEDDLAAAVSRRLHARLAGQAEQPGADAAASNAALIDHIRDLVRQRLPALRRMGLLDAGVA